MTLRRDIMWHHIRDAMTSLTSFRQKKKPTRRAWCGRACQCSGVFICTCPKATWAIINKLQLKLVLMDYEPMTASAKSGYGPAGMSYAKRGNQNSLEPNRCMKQLALTKVGIYKGTYMLKSIVKPATTRTTLSYTIWLQFRTGSRNYDDIIHHKQYWAWNYFLFSESNETW